MIVEIKLTLPEKLAEQIKRLGATTEQDIVDVLTDVLEIWLPTLENLSDVSLFPQISQLPDAEILKLADSKMDAAQNQRLGELQHKGKTTGLTEAESQELLTLIQIYQIGQLRKSGALAEAVQR